MDISMDIHEKSVDMDMDMDVIFHIHGNPGYRLPLATTNWRQVGRRMVVVGQCLF